MYLESDKIYNAKTRKYFKEVESSFINGNYRSATVMLYSIVLTDIVFKLEDLKDMYNDTTAKSILDSVDKNINNDPESPKWEKDLIKDIKEKTKLLDKSTQQKIDELKKWRNLSAHPILEENYDLLTPSKETVAALMHDMLYGLLVKPPLFIKSVIDSLTDDLKKKKNIYYGDDEGLKIFLDNKYFDKMTVEMKCNVFQTLWKFSFMKPQDKSCSEDREVLCSTMQILYRSAPDSICDHIRNNPEKFQIEKDELILEKNKLNCNSIVFHIALFLVKNPKCYNVLSEEVHNEFENLTNYHKDTMLLKEAIYFCLGKSDEKKCLNMLANLMDDEIGHNYDANTIRTLGEVYTNRGCFNHFIDTVIDYFGESECYDWANNRYDTAIKPYLNKMNEIQFKHLLEVSNANNQIYNRYAFEQTFMEIKDAIGDNRNIDLSKYCNLSSQNV